MTAAIEATENRFLNIRNEHFEKRDIENKNQKKSEE